MLLATAPDAGPAADIAEVDAKAVVSVVVKVVVWGWEWAWVSGLTCTSQGGGALLYDGTILNVTDPRASRCNTQNPELSASSLAA